MMMVCGRQGLKVNVTVGAECIERSDVWRSFHWAIDAQREMRVSLEALAIERERIDAG